MADLITSTVAAKIAGVGVSSIKRWADEGKIRVVRTPGGHRRFKRSELVSFLAREINGNARKEDAASAEWIERFLNLESYALQGELLKLRANLGSWSRVMDDLSTGLSELGKAWVDGRVTITQEHAAADKIARALAAIHDSMPAADSEPTCVLACVEGDLHTLGLAMLRVVLQESGWRSLWLGAPAPVEELERVIEEDSISMVALSASAHSTDEVKLEAQVRRISALCQSRGLTLIVGGSGRWPLQVYSAHRFSDFPSFASFVRNS